MKLTIDDYNFIKKIISLPKNKVNELDFPELKPSQFKYKLDKINYILKLFKKDSFYKRNCNFFIKDKNNLIFLLENLEFAHFNKNQRINIIVSKLLTEKFININSLAQEFKQSRTSIKKTLDLLKSDLKKFSLSLQYKYSYGTFIKGNEENIRLFFLNYFLTSKIEIDLKDKKEIIDKIVFEFLKGKNSPFETAKILSIVLYIQFYRIKTNNVILNIKYSKDDCFITISKEQKAMLYKYYDIEFLEEINYFLNYLSGLSYSQVDYVFENLYPDFKELFFNFISELGKSMDKNLINDKKLINQLIPHIETTIFKLVNKIPTRKHITNEIIDDFTDLIKIIQSKIKIIGKYFKIKFNSSEILFIAFHIKASLIRLENEKFLKKNVLLVCNLGPGVADMLKAELNKYFIINIIDTISYFQFQIYNLENIDFIIHTVPSFESNIPNLKINHILNNKDIEALKRLGFLSK